MKSEIEIMQKIGETKLQIRKIKKDNPKSEVWLRAYWTALDWVIKQ